MSRDTVCEWTKILENVSELSGAQCKRYAHARARMEIVKSIVFGLVIAAAMVGGCDRLSDSEILDLDSRCRELAYRYLAEEKSKIIELPDVSESYELQRMGYSKKKRRCLAVVTHTRVSFRPFETNHFWRVIDPARGEMFAALSASDITLNKEDARYYISKDGRPVSASKPFKDTDLVKKIEFDDYIEAQFAR